MVRGYHEDGSKKEETPYVEGKRQGVMIKYYEDGSKSSETPYVDGNANGTEIKYRRNGSKEMETVYVKHSKQSEVWYREDGSKWKEMPYKGHRFARHCRFVPQGRFDKGRNSLGEWQDKWHADWVPRGRVEGDGNPLRKRQRDLPKRILTRLNTILKNINRLIMVQIIIFSFVALSSYGSPDTDRQSLENLQENTEQWVNEIQLSGTFRLGGKGFASLITPRGNFWVEEGKSSSGYKLIELDTSQSQPSALIQNGDPLLP